MLQGINTGGTQRSPFMLARLPDAGSNRVGLVVNFSYLPEEQAVYTSPLLTRRGFQSQVS